MEIRVKKLKDVGSVLGKAAVLTGKTVEPPLLLWVEELDKKNPVLLYTKAPESILKNLKVAVKNAPVSVTPRASGLKNTSAVYGAQPRVEVRANCRACRFTKASFSDKAGFAVFAEALEWASSQYLKFFDSHHKNAVADVEKRVHKDWCWNKTPWLSISCNFNQAIKYHLDSGNMASSLSSVLIVSDSVKGGELSCPQLNINLAQTDGSLVLFRGDKLVHGVVPFEKTKPSGFRASIVFYTLENMKICQSFPEELKRANFFECSKAQVRFTPEHKLKVLRQAKGYFKEEEFKKHEKKWLKKVEQHKKQT